MTNPRKRKAKSVKAKPTKQTQPEPQPGPSQTDDSVCQAESDPPPPELQAEGEVKPNEEEDSLEVDEGGGLATKKKKLLTALTPEEDEEMAAIKVLAKKAILKKESVRRRLIRETRALRQLHHDNVVTLHDVMETEGNYYLVMNYIKGINFKHFLSKRSKLEEMESKPLIYQMAEAVHYMHSVKIVHRDLKPENFILDGEKLTVVDFGLSALLQVDGATMTTQCGSPAYAAPEIFTGKPYDKSVDIWSLGVILYLMVTKTLPFTTDGRSYTKLYSVILRGFDVPSHLSLHCVSLISDMINIEPSARITTKDLLEHPWLAEQRNKEQHAS